MALVPTTGPLTGLTAEGVEVTSTPLPVEHVVIKTNKPYPEVKAAIETLGRFDDSMRAMLAKNDIEGLRLAAQRAAGEDGLAIHYTAFHGDLAALQGERRQLIAYYIGNILSASEMTKVNPAAGLYECPAARRGLCQRAGWHDDGIRPPDLDFRSVQERGNRCRGAIAR
jgi:hypothetical protein